MFHFVSLFSHCFQSLLAFVGIGLGPIATSLFVDLVLIVAHDTILRPSNFSFIQFQQPLEPSSFRLHCKIIQSSNRIIFEIVLMILIHQSSIVAAQQYLRVLILRHHVESIVQKFGFPIYRTYLGNTSNSVPVLWLYQYQMMISEVILVSVKLCVRLSVVADVIIPTYAPFFFSVNLFELYPIIQSSSRNV